jgi:DNA replication ATP-dependent helicase Dna2
LRFRVVEATALDGEQPTLEATGAFTYAGRPGSSDRRAWDAVRSTWPDAVVSLFDALEVTDSRGGRYLAIDGRTSVVLDPWFPVSVTDVAKIEGVRAEACASRWLVDIRDAELPSRHLVVGGLAHDLLERLVQYAVDASDRESFDRLFDVCAAERRISALAAGMNDQAMRETRDALAEHFTHLLEWTDPRATTRRGRVAEASRVSSRYGLEGRIDLALLDDDTLRIVELKTGRRQRPEHERQVRAYALLWDPVAETEGRKVEGWLLYSQTGTKRPIRRRDHATEREVLRPRNALVALHRWFSHGDTAANPLSYGDDMDRCRDEACRFRRERCAAQCGILGSNDGSHAEAPTPSTGPLHDADRDLVVAARRYYTHFVSLVEREYRAASAAMGDVHQAGTVDERVRDRDAIAGARIDGADAAGRRVRFDVDNPGVFHAGDRVIAHRGDFDAQATINGRVVEATRDTLVVRSDGAAAAGALPDDGWVIDTAPARIGFRDMHRALFGLLASGNLRRLERIVRPSRAADGQRLLLQDAGSPPSFDASGARARELNAGQRRAVAAALNDHDALLIQGPPGTGKTTVIASLVAELVARGQRVLVAAHTNTAVDTALARIVDAGVIDVLRVGSASAASGDLVDALAARGRAADRHCTVDLAREATQLESLRNRIIETPVIAATTHRCSSSDVFALLARHQYGPTNEGMWRPTFDVAIVDEASQLTEPMCLAAVLRARRFVLVGDDRQLPAVVAADDALSATVDVAHASLRDAGVAGLDRSLFERLRPWTPCVMLTRQYRMNERVQAWPSRRYYGGRLQADPSVADRSLDLDAGSLDDLDPELHRRVDPSRPSVWVDVGDGETGNSHPQEAHEVARTVGALVRSWPGGPSALTREAIGVVAPFRAQCHAIRDALIDALGPVADLVEVDTVDRFQGREKEVMLVSLVRRQWCDFVMDPRRLNVTLTRARSKVIVFGATELGRRMVDELAGLDNDDSVTTTV